MGTLKYTSGLFLFCIASIVFFSGCSGSLTGSDESNSEANLEKQSNLAKLIRINDPTDTTFCLSLEIKIEKKIAKIQRLKTKTEKINLKKKAKIDKLILKINTLRNSLATINKGKKKVSKKIKKLEGKISKIERHYDKKLEKISKKIIKEELKKAELIEKMELECREEKPKKGGVDNGGIISKEPVKEPVPIPATKY